MAYSFDTGLKEMSKSYIDFLQVKVTKRTLEKDLEENPFYPSLLSLSDTFSKYKIDNKAYNIPKESFDDYDLETPFVAYAKIFGIGDDFVLITKMDEYRVYYQYKTGKLNSVSREEFISGSSSKIVYRDVIFKATANPYSGEREFEKNSNFQAIGNYRKWILMVCYIFLCAVAIKSGLEYGASLSVLTMAFLKMIGLFVTSVLLVFDINKDNAFVRNICSLNPKTNCNAVLNSKASKVFGISWGEIGFFYFTSSLLIYFFSDISFITKLSVLSVLNILAVPYVLFSIIYQWKVVKQWCPLCLAVQSVLLAEFFWSVYFVFPLNLESWDIYVSLSVFTCFLTPMVVWYTLKPVFRKANDYSTYRAAFKRLQYNPDIFKNLLREQDIAPDGWQKLGIDVGNVEAEHTILKICNPFCRPCDQAHPILEDIINGNPNVKLKIIYITRHNEHDPGFNIVRHLLAIAAEGDPNKLAESLDDWYIHFNKDYNAFKQKYTVAKDELERQDKKIDEMARWCDQAQINYTPTIYIDSKLMPENYEIEELKTFFWYF